MPLHPYRRETLTCSPPQSEKKDSGTPALLQGIYSGPKTQSWRSRKFNREHEIFLSEQLIDPNLFKRLTGPNVWVNSIPKIKVYQEIARRFSKKFEVDIDAKQIKNKVAYMKDKWREANTIANQNSRENLARSTQRERILARCHFYFILEPVWSEVWSQEVVSSNGIGSCLAHEHRGQKTENRNQVDTPCGNTCEHSQGGETPKYQISQSGPMKPLNCLLTNILSSLTSTSHVEAKTVIEEVELWLKVEKEKHEQARSIR